MLWHATDMRRCSCSCIPNIIFDAINRVKCFTRAPFERLMFDAVVIAVAIHTVATPVPTIG